MEGKGEGSKVPRLGDETNTPYKEVWFSTTCCILRTLVRGTSIRVVRIYVLVKEIPPPPTTSPSYITPTQQTPHTVSTIKLPILKKGEYDIWAMKMEHYLAHTDYPIWEVIQNGNGPVSITTDTSGQIKVQKPSSQLEIHGAGVSTEDANLNKRVLKTIGGGCNGILETKRWEVELDKRRILIGIGSQTQTQRFLMVACSLLDGSKGYFTVKGKIKTGKLDFEDVCFVKELQHFNLFSVSQMCDKKNKVLFTDSECLVLSPEFKLPDENQVLLKIPRQNNMYSFNLENIVPTGGLACLIAKATTDESNKWHRRLGHVNFKNLNKLVKGNLVRGLPSKIFQNDHTCVACQKGKQHKASCKAKTVSSISQTLQLLHMDLFGPTSVRSLNHKTYCLVITDDFSRFSWVFFLRTKDETSAILKDFIRQIENQLNQKVKTIRSDNGTEFKNKEVIEFCGIKGIKREYSNARTPQQNGVARVIERIGISDQASYYKTPSWNFLTGTEEGLLCGGYDKEDDTTALRLFYTAKLPSYYSQLLPAEQKEAYKEAEALRTKFETLGLMMELLSLALLTFLVLLAHQPKLAVDAMQEELLQFEIQKVWVLVDLPYGKKAIDTKWVYRNKKDERGVVVRNKARLEAIRIFLAFASYMGFIVYQMDVKSAFLYGKIDEEVYVSQPPGFLDPKYPEKVYKVVKALYGLHQAPRAWYATLSTFLLKNGYRRGTIDKTLFLKKDKHDIILVQVYVDDIIFGSTKKSWCDEFEALMKSRFQMSSMGELTFFLGLQVKQKPNGIFISQDKYVAEILKKFDFASVKTASTPIETQKPLVKDEEASDVDVHLYRSMIGSLMYVTASRPDIMFAVCACSRFQVTPKTSHLSAVKRIFRYLKGKPKLGLWYPRESSFDLESYSDSDYAGANLDRKSTTGGCQFLGRRLITWQCKKQTIVATSTTEAEYVAAASCCGQVLWIQNQMLDYGFNFMNTKIYIDNESTICIVKNPVYHSKTKHIAIRHHFIRDAYEKKLIQVLKIHTNDNVADLLTKAFDVSRFQFLVVSIGMINP
ncbi:putative ribonuclease H-like domain-containing protein [Tanacetum coccineum]